MVATCAATVGALRVLGVRRIALIDPPWFDDELNRFGRGYYEDTGFAVVFSAPCALPSGQHLIRPGDLHDWVSGHTPHDAEAVVVGGNGLRAVGAVERLEQTLRRPVLTANQTLLWAALRATGTATTDIEGFGQLFSAAAIAPASNFKKAD
ncbi:hypothetical protein [Streptomyces sp. V4I8]|uniref:aspartate racemase/maleate isomerase family protein n=1 Tax=Streptomyces sp. V4I8 TaxID=3156469 RepID=UPI0035168463